MAVAPPPKPTFTVRLFPDDETTEMVYPVVTHCFWEANNTVLTLCLPDGEHAHWPRERFRHYSVMQNPMGEGVLIPYLDDSRHT